ncbi:OmpA family protein [Alteriqipengyuania lutimaris]|uniref:OmpA family protein n=1 Tax=Alteriqipengyuania lutimaris TaxID=1538146 RepID=A0A395LIT0_9SPHN|nr:OmpA family protein [Alteriqipengyuania lutimaris]MBB3034488.1 OOP family OmpA-OmpF porin [Alteriqipengyuania lutimaris]RDS76621.1 OmpA family protein [Alteriqipengyuania lutimaris]
MRGPIIILALGALVAGCEREEPAPAPEPTPTATATGAGQEQASIIRPEMEVERPPIALEPLRATIPFADGGSELDDASLGELRNLVETDQWQQVERVILRGHSDAGGSDAVNMRISEERAQTVADWLQEQGLDKDSIRVIAFGAQNPVQPNLLPNGEPNERGRAANRRVEVTILVPEGATIPDPGPTATPGPSGPPSAPPTSGAPKSIATQ